MMFTFSILGRKYPFWVNLFKKYKSQFKTKSDTQTNLNMKNLMVMFTFRRSTLVGQRPMKLLSSVCPPLSFLKIGY